MLLYKLGYITCFATIAFFRFYIRFLVYDHYFIIAACILLCHLCSFPPVSCSCLIIPYVPLFNITCYITTCSCMLVPTIRFSMHVYDSDLLIHVCLSMHAIWH